MSDALAAIRAWRKSALVSPMVAPGNTAPRQQAGARHVMGSGIPQTGLSTQRGKATAFPGLPGSPAGNPIETHGALGPAGTVDGNHAAGVAKGFKIGRARLAGKGMQATSSGKIVVSSKDSSQPCGFVAGQRKIAGMQPPAAPIAPPAAEIPQADVSPYAGIQQRIRQLAGGAAMGRVGGVTGAGAAAGAAIGGLHGMFSDTGVDEEGKKRSRMMAALRGSLGGGALGAAGGLAAGVGGLVGGAAGGTVGANIGSRLSP